MDEDAPLTVAKGTVAAAAVGALTGAGIGVARYQPAALLAVNMGFNCGMFGLTFFAFREYAVTPAFRFLQQQRRGGMTTTTTTSSAGDDGGVHASLRRHKLLESAVAGVMAGGLINGWVRGPRGIVPGAVTISIISTALQLGLNEARVMRVRLVSSYGDGQLQEVADGGNGVTAVPATTPDTTAGALPLPAQPDTAPPKEEDAPSSSSIGTTILSSFRTLFTTVSPVRRVSDDEYERTLRAKLVDVEMRLGEVERQLEGEGIRREVMEEDRRKAREVMSERRS